MTLYNNYGDENSAFGEGALQGNVVGANNSAFGRDALLNSTGSNNVGIGESAGETLVTGSNNIYIANNLGTSIENDTIRIGTAQTRLFLPSTLTPLIGTTLDIDGSGRIGPTVSSARFKKDIEALSAEEATALLEKLRPVTYRYRNQVGSAEDNAFQYGLIAEEVAEVVPALVIYDEDGKPYSVQYQALGPMLIGAMQKQQREIENLKLELSALQGANR